MVLDGRCIVKWPRATNSRDQPLQDRPPDDDDTPAHDPALPPPPVTRRASLSYTKVEPTKIEECHPPKPTQLGETRGAVWPVVVEISPVRHEEEADDGLDNFIPLIRRLSARSSIASTCAPELPSSPSPSPPPPAPFPKRRLPSSCTWEGRVVGVDPCLPPTLTHLGLVHDVSDEFVGRKRDELREGGGGLVREFIHTSRETTHTHTHTHTFVMVGSSVAAPPSWR